MKDLPTGDENTWTPLDRRRIMLLAWHMMHELSHAIASVFAKMNMISQNRTPEQFEGFQGAPGRRYDSEVIIDEKGSTEKYGERGWWIEDKMGGHLRMKDEVMTIDFLASQCDTLP